jgi:hypothetical protein
MLRKDLDGLRIRMPGQDGVYLIDQGKKRGIPSIQLYNQLFKTWDNIHLDLDIEEIDTGENLPTTAVLFRCVDDPRVFFLDGCPPNQIKRHIFSPAVMDRFQFDWTKVHVWYVSIDAIKYPDGPEITRAGRPD